MDERTEEAALSGLLTITVGGKPVELPVLTIEQSEKWLRGIGVALGRVEVPDADTEPGVTLGNMLAAGGLAILDVVLAYDVEGRLGGPTVRSRMTKRELVDALERMLDAEDPKEEDAHRSVVEAFGRQSQMVGVGLRTVLDAASLRPAPSTNGHSPNGDSTPELSVVVSPTSSSSSSGPTARSARGARKSAPR